MSQHVYKVFEDFVEMAAISISNAVDRAQAEKREAVYMSIVKRHSRETVMGMAQLLGIVTKGLSDGECDFLGECFMNLDLGNKYTGQFFTPFYMSRLMAQMTFNDDELLKDGKPFITLCDPTAGAGSTLIAFAAEMRARGYNYQRQLHVTAQDIDHKVAHMCYIQLSLLHIPAIVIVGDTLKLEQREVWYTPAHILGGWNYRLRAAKEERKQCEQEEERPVQVIVPADESKAIMPPAPAVESNSFGQFSLF